MSNNRVVYRNWIVEIGCDPARLKELCGRDDLPLLSLDDPAAVSISSEDALHDENAAENVRDIRRAVQEALQKLPEQEREFIKQFYFMGRSYREISELSGRPLHKLEALHQRAIKKLRRLLGGFVRERFGIEPDTEKDCLLCRSKYVEQINRLIAGRDKTATWKPVMKILREKYNLRVTSQQVLIGHEKYHIQHTSSSRGKNKGGKSRGK
jgi:hypothetical protein